MGFAQQLLGEILIKGDQRKLARDPRKECKTFKHQDLDAADQIKFLV